MKLPEFVKIQEVCPRDGWQNHKKFIPTETKIAYIKRMMDYGAKQIEATSFVNPKAVPQMADAFEVVAGVMDDAREKGVTLTGLALNKRGVEDAKACGLKHVSFVLSASEEHNLRNSGKTIQQSLKDFKSLAECAQDLDISLALPCVFGSPFGDEIPLERIQWLIEEAFAQGVTEIGLADTAGISTPEHTRCILREIKAYADVGKLSLHMHDTYGMGLANCYAALEEGVTRMDASLAGMGGCPFVPGAKGNIATEDLIYMLHKMGIKTGYDLEMLNQVAAEMAEEIRASVVSCQGAVCRH